VRTDRVRLRVDRSRNWRGRVNGDLYRATCLELEVYGPTPSAAPSATAPAAGASSLPTASPSQ
jgi:hypothetical protein